MDPTYELISEQVLTSNQSSISFTNIPQSYRDLCILASSRGATTGFGLRFNNDSGSNYSWRRIYGNGTGVFNDTNATYGGVYNTWFYTMQSQNSYTSSTFGNTEVYIPNYRSNTNKSISSTAVGENNASSSVLGALSGLWSNTSPINSITVVCDGGDFVTGSSFQLYGIKNADDGGRGFFGPAMTGGDEVYTTGNGYKVHVFKNSGTLNVTAPGEVEYLVVGGGGAGSWAQGGGGGAGGLLAGSLAIQNGSHSVLVGAGGAGGNTALINGSPSTIGNSIYAHGGGGGATLNSTPGANGGSGGGGSAQVGVTSGGSAISGQGNPGASGTGFDLAGGGGGGGGSSGSGRQGGSGISSSISGINTFYAGGGSGGAKSTSTQPGGSSIGGTGSGNTSAGTSGVVNTGSGGGGGGSVSGVGNGAGGSGGSGIVIIRYRI